MARRPHQSARSSAAAHRPAATQPPSAMADVEMPQAAEVATPRNSLGGELAKLPWVEKYRPSSLGELVAHEDIVRMVERMMVKKQLPHMLLHGPPGTGKTSTIIALARTMFKEKFKSMTLELNASDARGIDVVRNEIKTFVSVKQLFGTGATSGHPKLVILDEADNMTNTAQFALRRMIEQYAPNARFILICNYSSKIIPALQSRCTKLRFAPLTEEQIIGRLNHVAQCEGVELTEDGARAIVRVGKGDMRKVLNIFQTTSMGHGSRVNAEAVHASTGVPSPEEIDQFLKTLMSTTVSFAAGLQGLQEMLVSKGYAVDDFLTLMHQQLVALDLPTPQRVQLITALADIDWRLKQGCSDRVQLAAIVGAFHEARAAVAGRA